MKKKLILIFLIVSIMIAGCTFQRDSISPEEAAQRSIGYIGCSNTRETVEGYYHMGGKKMWDAERRYGSGTILDWSQNLDNSKYWKVFDKLLEKYPKTNTIWLQFCIMDENRATSYEHVSIILNEINKRIPNVTIYVSPLAEYTDGVCEITGTFGIEKGQELVQELVSRNEEVLLGPILGPMSSIDTAEDGCHLSSPDGKRKLGMQMKEFFDKNTTVVPAELET